LNEKNRPRRIKFNDNGNNEKNRDKQWQSKGCTLNQISAWLKVVEDPARRVPWSAGECR